MSPHSTSARPPASRSRASARRSSSSRSGEETEGGYAAALDEAQHRREQELVAAAAAEADGVITTALIPGRPAPILLTREAVRGMRRGSVVVDLAAEAGGNCEDTQPGETVEVAGVTVIGALNLPSTCPSAPPRCTRGT